jgi:hypothetical protein
MSSRRHLLWIDDDASGLLRPLHRHLTAHGFDVDVALDYSTAIELLSSKSYDAVLADVILPLTAGRGALSPYVGVDLLKDVRQGRYFQSNSRVGTPPDAIFAFLTVVPHHELSTIMSTEPYRYFDKSALLEPGVMDSLVTALRGE